MSTVNGSASPPVEIDTNITEDVDVNPDVDTDAATEDGEKPKLSKEDKFNIVSGALSATGQTGASLGGFASLAGKKDGYKPQGETLSTLAGRKSLPDNSRQQEALAAQRAQVAERMGFEEPETVTIEQLRAGVEEMQHQATLKKITGEHRDPKSLSGEQEHMGETFNRRAQAENAPKTQEEADALAEIEEEGFEAEEAGKNLEEEMAEQLRDQLGRKVNYS